MARKRCLVKRWAAIVLAAGQSSRFGVEDKLQADLHGKPVLEHVLDALEGLDQTILVARLDSMPVSRSGVTTIHNPRPETGMGVSLSLGAKALEPCDGVFVALGDMPIVDTAMLQEMKRRLEGHDIVAPKQGSRYGHPVLFGPACFDALERCTGDIGARHLLTTGDYRITTCPIADAASQLDIDTIEDLSHFRRLVWL